VQDGRNPHRARRDRRGGLYAGIDLVFSDIRMPGDMDGITLAHEIKSRRPHLPVLLTSGYPDATQKDFQSDGLQVLAKPYGIEELKGALTRAFESRLHGAIKQVTE
jgi:DNA-binding NtrC family response regulator